MLLIPLDSDQAYRIMRILLNLIESKILPIHTDFGEPDWFAEIVLAGLQTKGYEYKELKPINFKPLDPIYRELRKNPEKMDEYISNQIIEAYYRALKEHNVREADLLVVYSNHYLACFLLTK